VTFSGSVLVTGAASGIGAALCRRLARPAVSILIHTGHRLEAAQRVAADCVAKGAQCRVAVGDLSHSDTPARLVDEAQSAFGALDAVVANAGFADRRKIGELDEAGLQRSLAVMIAGLFGLAEAAYPLLARRGGGRIVAVSSFLAHIFRLGGQAFPASAAAKAGMEGLARSLAAQFASDGITVNCIVPGYVRKDAGTESSLDEAGWRAALDRIPVGRLGSPDEIAATIEFLLTPSAAYITGQTIHVDGGLTL
jgi:3-oxoacyl-[acyl-carrier protein] reductase